MKLKTAGIIPDVHRPFHSVRAYNLMLEVFSHVGLDEIVILGDYGDFVSVTSHARDPLMPQFLKEEVRSVVEGLDELDRLFPKAKKVYLCGNHEFRLERYLDHTSPALLGVTSVPDILRIPQRRRWSYVPYGRNQSHRVLGTELHARHTPLAANAKSSLQRSMISHCYGHVHRIEEVRAVGLDGRPHVAFSPGWLGDARSRAFEYLQNPEQWSLGFGLVYSDGSSSKSFHHEIVEIKKNFVCVAQGKRFKG